MITVTFLCAHLAGGWGCLPLNTMADCRAAKDNLPAAIVMEGICEEIEVFVPGSSLAPEMTAQPKRRTKS